MSNLGRTAEVEPLGRVYTVDTIDALQGTYNAQRNAVIGFLPIQPYRRRITSIVIQGPAASTFKLYRGDRPEPMNQLTATPTGGGEDNTYDSTTDGAPVSIGPGEQAIGVWTGGATAVGSRGTATLRSVIL